MAANRKLFDTLVKRAREDQPRKRTNPYPGIRPFDEDTRENFFGRESQIGHVLRHLERTHFAAVVGGSGCGKSSIVRAGVVPRIRSFGIQDAGDVWRVAIFKPQQSPLESLACALDEQVLNFKVPKEKQRRKLDQVLALLRGKGGTFNGFLEEFREDLVFAGAGAQDSLVLEGFKKRLNLLIVADQFEEMFREPNRDSKEAKRVVDLLHDVFKEHYQRVFVIITMRSEDLHECAAYQELPDAINAGAYLVRRLSWEERREAILRPALRALGWSLQCDFRTQPFPFDQQTLDTIQGSVEALRDDPDHLPLMQHLLWRLWNQAERDGALEQAGPKPEEIFKMETLAGVLDLESAELCGLIGTYGSKEPAAPEEVGSKGANLGWLLRGGEPPQYLGHLKGALERDADGLYGSLSERQKAIAEIVLRLLAERDRNGQEKRCWTDKGKIASILQTRTKHTRESSGQGIDQDIDTVLMNFGVVPPDSGIVDSDKTHRHPFLSMSPEGIIDVSHEAFIRKWPIFQDLLKQETDAGKAYQAIVASFQPMEAAPHDEAPHGSWFKRLAVSLRRCWEPVRARWKILFSPDSLVNSGRATRDAVCTWLNGRVFAFERADAEGRQSWLQRTHCWLRRRFDLERRTEFGRSIEFARRYNAAWSARHVPGLDSVRPEDGKPLLEENENLFESYVRHARSCMRWRFGRAVAFPALLSIGALAFLYNWRTGEIQEQERIIADLQSRAASIFALANGEQRDSFNHLNAQSPLPFQIFQAELFEVAAAFKGLDIVEERIREVAAWRDDTWRLEQKRRLFQASVSLMAANVLDHTFSLPPDHDPNAASQNYDHEGKEQRAALLSACPNVPFYNDGKFGQLVAATKWYSLSGVPAPGGADAADVWKVVYQMHRPAEKSILLTFGVVVQCDVRYAGQFKFESMLKTVDFSDNDLNFFSQYPTLESKGQQQGSAIYRIGWNRHTASDWCDDKRLCDDSSFSASADAGRYYIGVDIPADVAMATIDQWPHLESYEGKVQGNRCGESDSALTSDDGWKVRWNEPDSTGNEAVAEGTLMIETLADRITLARNEDVSTMDENQVGSEMKEGSNIVACVLSEAVGGISRIAYLVENASPSMERNYVLNVLEISKDALVENLVRTPVWFRKMFMESSIRDISFDERGDSIVLFPRDGPGVYRVVWSPKTYWQRVCELLEKSGVAGELEERYHSREFRMFKSELASLMKDEGAVPNVLSREQVCRGADQGESGEASTSKE